MSASTIATPRKYTLGEAAVTFLAFLVGIPSMIIFLLIVSIPLGAMTAWIRMTIWNWFMPAYFHLPAVPFWAMFMLGILTGTFSPATPTFKDEVLKHSIMKSAMYAYLAQFIAFGVAWGVHHWFLKG